MQRIAAFFVRAFEQAIPDPYIFAVALTILTAILAFAFAPHHGVPEVLAAWYKGLFDILAFALQMILILVTGYALASSVPVERALSWLAQRPRTPRGAVSLTLVVSAAACWLNWGFGLVVAALLARSIAARMRIDYGWLVAAAYSGFLVWASGPSSSIALAQATPGSKLNIVQALTGQVLPLGSTIFTRFNLVPAVIVVLVLAVLFRQLQPRDTVTGNAEVSPDAARAQPESETGPRRTFAFALENAWAFNLILVVAGLGYLAWRWKTTGFALDIDSLIFVFFLAGLLLHWRPIAYVRAVNNAARVTGPLIIQYPLYGGIMGIMTATGLAAVIARWFDAFATGASLPFWSYLASIVITFFIPSGGGHWAVQGPFAVPAAVRLHASLPATAMGVAMGEQVANMLQPFWALPVLAIAGVGLQRVMAFTVVSFAVAFVIFGAALLFLT